MFKSNKNSDNLSERLFDNHKQAKETSALTQYMSSSQGFVTQKIEGAWYRTLRRMQWAWQGIDSIDQEEVLARIASSSHSRTVDEWLDTVMGYRQGNWAYEWNKLGTRYQHESARLEGEASAERMFAASLCFSIAGYPHLKNDTLAIQAQALANTAYTEAAKRSGYIVKQLEFPYKNKNIIAHLHLSHTERPQPVVIVTAGLDSLQTDMWRLFRDYLAHRDIAMLTIDMPSIGYNSQWPLTEDTSVLHQTVLNQLARLPWVDHHRVGLIGFRFGGNAMVRLSFIESNKIKACIVLGAPVHDILSSPEKLKRMPKMYLDVLASRLGKNVVDIDSLSMQLRAWSLKAQGFLSGRKTKTPILALGLEGDPVSPPSDNRLVATYSVGGQAKEIKSKTLFHGYEQALDLAINWLEDELIQ
ncbi:esterase FrsA [Vibrio gazogenes]|uniref:Esterase FrsA n=1 Tax=Vibrio gazogenes DSM 21264 = NBRC 103151 TaxID=1123492 RepID=A0A1M4X044_VIBGA|nr:esterase FrsA [Vibrio gazogenes]USP13065.1 esterase FrsA [Vibrio gazogenes]SHE86844.1 esterase FrsA [Vibrio gazogenes DSM 21264] [Vibrio gazogenes DSM 21264 = NBRC 103151]SJN57170.1 2,6-dihydropseudooxynicotine hydrolase [Vibrio gazogenes]